MTIFLVVTLIWLPQIMNSSFSLLMCDLYEDDGKYYLRKDTSIVCWDGSQKYFQLTISLILISVWGLIFPFVVYFAIKKEKGRLNKQSSLKIYGIFYVGLTDDNFHWEILVMNIRKLILIVAATFLNNERSTYKVIISINNILIYRV
jgi:hypothetical protein